MSSSSSTSLAIDLKTLLSNLDILGEQHIASITYIERREKGHVQSLELVILYLSEGKKKQIG